ncbi:MAG TPA: PepSY-associated TM helix domain-containing protein, partial [Sphingobacteriaceae bacterium]
VFVHPSSGEILETRNTYKSFVTWVLYLHYSLHARLIGQVVVLLAGLAFLISILTGMWIYRKAIMDMLLLRIKFRSKNKRSVASSLHRHLGVWALLLNLIIVSSGVLISYDIVFNGIKSAGKAKQLVTPQIGFSINQAVETLKQQYPEFQPSSMRFPTAPGLPLRINGRVEGQNIFWSKNYNSALLDPQTGTVQALKLHGNADGKTKVASFSRGVHFLEFANLPVKILFCLAALSAPVLSITGFMLWYWGKKKKGRGK